MTYDLVIIGGVSVASRMQRMREAARYGIVADDIRVDFARVWNRCVPHRRRCQLPFTNAAGMQGANAALNALLGLRRSFAPYRTPWATFTAWRARSEGGGASRLASRAHPYPTFSESTQRAALQLQEMAITDHPRTWLRRAIAIASRLT